MKEAPDNSSPRIYGSRILDHFRHPRNTGLAERCTHRYLEEHNPWLVRILLTLRVEDDRIAEVKFKARSCVTTVACMSALTELLQGRTVAEALAITPTQLSEYLGVVPEEKGYCCRLAVAALHHALRQPPRGSPVPPPQPLEEKFRTTGGSP